MHREKFIFWLKYGTSRLHHSWLLCFIFIFIFIFIIVRRFEHQATKVWHTEAPWFFLTLRIFYFLLFSFFINLSLLFMFPEFCVPTHFLAHSSLLLSLNEIKISCHIKRKKLNNQEARNINLMTFRDVASCSWADKHRRSGKPAVSLQFFLFTL